jgi:hypothetical protein
MADTSAPVVHIGENSPEHVAYRLLMNVAFMEDKLIAYGGSNSTKPTADRKWLLDTYAECLNTVRHPQMRVSPG